MPALRHYLHLHFIVFIWGFTAILGLLLQPLGTPALAGQQQGHTGRRLARPQGHHKPQPQRG